MESAGTDLWHDGVADWIPTAWIPVSGDVADNNVTDGNMEVGDNRKVENGKMNTYRWTVRVLDRRNSTSVVAAAAYRAGVKLHDEETGRTHDYTWKQGILYTEVFVPPYAPLRYLDRQILWNSVQDADAYVNARLAREVEMAIPSDLESHIQIELVRKYVLETFVSAGMCADVTIHQRRNKVHAHILLTTRPLDSNGTWGRKSRSSFRLDACGERIPVVNPATGQQKIGRRQEKMWQRDIEATTNFSNGIQTRVWRERWTHFCDRCLADEVTLL